MQGQKNIETHAPRNADLIKAQVGRGEHSHGRKRKHHKPIKPAGWLAYLVLIIVTIGVYAPIFKSPHLWSPYDQVERSTFESMEHLGEAWSIESIRHDDPITLTSYFLEQMIPLAPATSHHAINLLLHITAVVLLMRLLDSLKLAAAFSASLVFAIHPTILQTIFWAGYRTELIGLILFLCAMTAGLRNRNIKDFLALITYSSVAYLIHPANLLLPFTLGFAIFYTNKALDVKNCNRLLPLICLAIFIGVWTQSGQAGIDMNFSDRISVASGNLHFFLKQALIPFELSLFHPYSQSRAYNTGGQNSILPFLLFIPFFALAAYNYQKKWARGVILGLGTYLLLVLYGISQIGSFIDGSQAYEDHFQYIALPFLIALVICTAGGIARTVGNGGKLLWYVGFSFFIIIQLAVTTTFTASVSQPAQMWKDMAQQWPETWLPKLALIETIQADGGDSDLLSSKEMIDTLVNILEKQPDRIEERILLTRIYVNEQQNNNALTQYKRILREINPSDEFLIEAAAFYDKLGFSWDANKARERITSNSPN